jgi:parallel beta-helix repeat protein
MRLAALLAAIVLTGASFTGLRGVDAQIYLYDVVFITPETTQAYVGDPVEVWIGFGFGFEIPHPPVITFTLRWDPARLSLLDGDTMWPISPTVIVGEDHFNVTMGNPFMSTSVMLVTFEATAVGTALLDLCNANIGTGDGYVSIYPQPPLPAAVHNLDTGLNYTTIQAAIDAPETLAGHIILVDAGTYFEHVVVDKPISLTGEDMLTTTIDGSLSETVIRVVADNVSIAGFTLQHSGHLGSDSGIYLYNASFSHVRHTRLAHNKYGIKFDYSPRNCFESNVVQDNDDGIYLTLSSSHNLVAQNTVEDNVFGITVKAANNTLTNNTVTRSGRGIIVTADNTTLTNNTVTHTTGDGILLIDNSHTTLTRNTIEANTGYGIRIHSSSHNTLQNNTLAHNRDAIFVFTDSNHNRLIGNTLTANTRGIYLLYYSTNNSLIANTATGNGIGIQLTQSCNNNTLTANVAFANTLGLGLKDSRNNTVTGNQLLSNQQGLTLEAAANHNTFSRNSFVNNAHHVLITASADTCWDTDDTGNYWSNYTGVDADGDGIGDTPFPIDADNTDHYPLMTPAAWWTQTDINYDLKVNIFDVVLVCIAYTATPSAPNWNPRCDIAEPYGIIDIYDLVAVCNRFGATYTP